MKALVFEQPQRAVVRDVDVPAIGADEVLVRSRNVGICHSDFELYEGRYIIPITYPIIPGHEWSGEIAEAGSDVTSLRRAIGSSGNASSTTATTILGSRSAEPMPSTSSPRRPGCIAFPMSCRSPRVLSSSPSRLPTAPPSRRTGSTRATRWR